MVLRMTGLRSCCARVVRLRSSGRPASMSVASWRVKVVRIFTLTLPPFLTFGAFSFDFAAVSSRFSSSRCG